MTKYESHKIIAQYAENGQVFDDSNSLYSFKSHVSKEEEIIA